jgi:hypothetical protein
MKTLHVPNDFLEKPKVMTLENINSATHMYFHTSLHATRIIGNGSPKVLFAGQFL